MNIDVKVRYQESYLPTKRHRIPRFREAEETVSFELREIQKTDASLAMVVTDYKSYLDESGTNQFGLVDTPIFAVGEQLYTQKKDMSGALDRGPYTLDALIKDIHGHAERWYTSSTKEDAIQDLRAFIDSHLLIDGQVFRETAEPRYVINTFGLGHNHGGTAMFVSFGYNPNISSSNYFNALQRDEAISYANAVAERRGDTLSVGTFDKENIAVYMPKLIRCNPQLDHGDGNPLLNSLEQLVQSSDNTLEAGLLVLTEASSITSREKKPTLSEQIQSAASHTANSQSAKEPQIKEPTPER